VNDQLKKMDRADLERRTEQPNPKFDDDPRDTATPAAMVKLLAGIVEAKTLSPASSTLLLDVMQRTTTGLKRLRGMLPPDVVVRDKTGTIGGTVNDVGVIELPNGLGHVVIAVFIKKSPESMEQRESAIAQIARGAYDYMLVASAGASEPVRSSGRSP
jgi:beta-lactamase class A